MPQPDLQNFNLIQKQIAQTSKSQTFQSHIQLITQIVELPFNRSDATILIMQCLNNFAVQFQRNDLLCNQILKFASSHLLKNGQFHCNLVSGRLISFIAQLNMAKLKFQFGQCGKAFLLAEKAMRSMEQELLERLKHKDYKVGDATLLCNGYLMLAKSYQFSSEQDLCIIRSKSEWAQKSEDFGKFYFNAKQLSLKYLGSSQLYSYRIKKHKELGNQSITRAQYAQLQKLFKIVKSRVVIIAIERPRRLLRSSMEPKSSVTKFRTKRYEERISSNETTIEKTEKPIFQQLESIINKKVEEQLQESRNETQQKISNLESWIQNLTEQIKEKEKIQEQQNTQIELLKRQQTKKQLQQSSIKKPLFINEFQISSEQKQIFVQSAIKRTDIKEFMTEQTPTRIIKEFQTPKKQCSIKEFQTDQNSAIPFSFSFHKQQEQPKTPTDQQCPSQKHISLLEIEDMNFSFTYQFNNEEYSVVIMPNEIYCIDVHKEQKYQIEVSMISEKSSTNLDDYCLLIQISIDQQRMSEMIDIQSLQQILAHTQNVCTPYPLKYLTSYKLFIQHLLLPFITIQDNQKVALYHLPQSLLDNYVAFQNLEWSLHYLDNYRFKVALFSDKLFSNQIELQFDQVSFDQYFELLNVDEYIQQEMNNLINNKLSNKTRNYYKLPTVRVKNKETIIELIQSILNKIDFKDKLISIKIDEIIKIKCYTIEKDYTIVIKNLYQSYLAKKLQCVQDSIKITNQIIQDRYHIDFQLLSEDERQFLLLKLVHHLKLFSYSTIEEGEEMEWKNENPISFYEQDFGGTHKIMCGDNYKYPMHVTIIGIHNKPEFVRIDKFNVDSVQQDGILFFINEQQWRIIAESPKKKGKQTKYNKGMQGDYYLNIILDNWKILYQVNSGDKKILRLEQFLSSKILQEN